MPNPPLKTLSQASAASSEIADGLRALVRLLARQAAAEFVAIQGKEGAR